MLEHIENVHPHKIEVGDTIPAGWLAGFMLKCDHDVIEVRPDCNYLGETHVVLKSVSNGHKSGMLIPIGAVVNVNRHVPDED